MNPTQEKSHSPPAPIFVFAFRPCDLGRHIHSNWNHAERHTKSKALHVSRFCLGGRVMATRTLQISALVHPPGKAFFPSLVIHGPRFEQQASASVPVNRCTDVTLPITTASSPLTGRKP